MDVTWQGLFWEQLIQDLIGWAVLAGLYLVFSIVCIIAIWWTHKY